jgi:ATP/maltotriose-dependent transcriptional regulator MalT
MDASDLVREGRAAMSREAWGDACRLLREADRLAPLEPADLERLGTAAFLIGDEATSADALRRAHTGFLAEGDITAAARCAFWQVVPLIERPDQQAAANGWLVRLGKLLDDCPAVCAERGFWLCATGHQKIRRGDIEAGASALAEAARIGVACNAPDVVALARQAEGRYLLQQQRIAEGLDAFDEVMVSISCGEVGPMIAGIVYCSVIGACHEVFDVGRAREWTGALSEWCARHPDLVPFRTACLVRRSELLQMQGAWAESIDEAQRACSRISQAFAAFEAGPAYFQRAELHRLRGEFAEAEAAYDHASQAGRVPQPGRALMRLARGETAESLSDIKRAMAETRNPRARVEILRAAVTIAVAAGSVDEARHAESELTTLAGQRPAPYLEAAAAAAKGAVQLASGDAGAALTCLRVAADVWREIDVPYESARARALMGDAYWQRGDADGARHEWESAQEIFERLGAAPDVEAIAARLASPRTNETDALTGREIEVLRLVATGLSNRAIGSKLEISEKTVARHISNIFTKLDLSSRTAATAYAYEHKLL